MNIYGALFFATLSTIVVPLPEEAALLGAGYAVRLGQGSFVGCALAAGAAVLLGDVVSYCVGRLFLSRLLRTRLGRKFLPEERRAWAERLVAAHGARAVVLARFLVGLRGFVYFAVGASRYPFARFVAVDAAAGAVEIGGLVGVGFAFGSLRAHVGRSIDLAAASVLLLVMLAPAAVRVTRARAERNRRAKSSNEGA